MSAADAIVKVQVLDDVWQVLGDREGRLIYPQGLGYSHNDHGAESAHFTLPRRAGTLNVDLSAWTPCEVWVGGALGWEGRIRSAPEQQGGQDSISVEGVGWQSHADDDVYWKRYVETDVTEFKDSRGLLTADLTVYHAGGSVSTDENGAPMISWPKNIVVPANGRVGVTLDLGPAQDAAHAIITLAHSAAASSAGVTCIARFHAAENAATGVSGTAYTDFISTTLTATSSPVTTTATVGAVTAGPRRYLSIFLFWAAGGTITADTYVKITGLRLASSTAYATQLLASDVVKDALAAMPLLSQNQSWITTTAFALPAYSPDGMRTPRAYIDDVNALHDYQWRVRAGLRLQYRARPSAPIYTAGGWGDAAFAYASANSGEDIYSDIIGQGRGPDGSQLSVRRVSVPNQYRQDRAAGQGPSNPSFTVDASGWTATLGTISRVTGTFNSSPASGQLVNTAGSAAPTLVATLGTAFVVGQTYRMRVYLRNTTANTSNIDIHILDSGGARVASLVAADLTDAATGNTQTVANTWGERHILFTATTTTHTVQILPTATTPASSLTLINVDDLILERSVPTLVNRRGFRRSKTLDVGMPTTTAVLTQLADVYLSGHHSTPFAGSLRVGSERDVRRLIGGAGAAPELLGWDTGELVLFAHMIDPDTGGVGRAGRITTVSYDHASRSASLDIDNTRRNFDALLSRLGVLSA